MSRTNASEKTVSDAQLPPTTEHDGTPPIEHAPSTRAVCPECESQVITTDETSFCTACGLIVADEWVDRSPTLTDLGMVGDADQSIETVDPLRTDKGLHTKIGKSTDGHGNPLTNAQWERAQRLRKWHNRIQFSSERSQTKRLNEGLRDVEMIGGNLGLPDHVTKQAARYLRWGSEARLPGGRMAWESLAGGAVLLAVRDAALEREAIDAAVATYAKAPRERVCAAARKLRCECALDVPVTRPDAVVTVLEGLDDGALPGARAVRTWQLAQHLLALADRVPIGPGTPRATVAGAALYAADRLLDGSQLTQPQVVAAVEPIVSTSRHRIGPYSRELVDAYTAAHGTDDPAVGLAAARDSRR